jgi:cyclopropane fatty-acyl-phospholipid synthase-like methyltransferase
MSSSTRELVKAHYSEKARAFELIWSKYFHYGLFENAHENVETAKERTIQTIAKAAGAHAGQRVLDVGCGIGSTSIYLANTFRLSMVGIDPVAGNLSRAEEQAESLEEARRPKFQLGSAETHDFGTGEFDGVISNEVFCHVDDVEKVFRECHRVLAEGGWFGFTDLIGLGPRTPASQFFYDETKQVREPCRLEQYSDALRSIGFRDILAKDWSRFMRLTYEASAIRLPKITFCSHLAMRGAPALSIQKLAGHQNLQTTLRYMHLSPGETQRAIALLDRAPGVGEIVETNGNVVQFPNRPA